MANAHESELHYVFGDTLPERRPHAGRCAAGVLWVRMRLPFALDHINLWLLRDHEDTPSGRREGWAIVDCGIDNDETRAAWEQVFATAAAGPAGAARHLHAHAPRPHRPGALAHRTLELPAVDQRHRLERGARGQQRRSATRTAATARRTSTPATACATTMALAKVRARSNYYATMVQQVPGAVPPADARHAAAHRRARVGVHRRLWPRAGAHRAVLPRLGWRHQDAFGAAPPRGSSRPWGDPAANWRADFRRHGAAAHLHQHQRLRHRARGQPAAAVSGVDRGDASRCRPTRWCCPRTASPSRGCTGASPS